MVKIAKAGGKLAASRSGSRNNDNWFCGFNVFICPVTLIADYKVDISGITLGWIMKYYLYSPELQLVFECPGRRLVLVPGNDDSRDVDAPFPEVIDSF